MVEIKTLSGREAQAYLQELARLRIAVFREFPYLYDGDMAYEEEYLHTFFQAPDSVLVVVLDGGAVVGASTGLPLEQETANIQQPFLEQGLEVGRIFYCGESVLLPEYRGRGIGVRFFEERERWARRLERFDTLAFCAVVRPEDHPRRPADYVPLDAFWRRRGFERTELYCYISWRDLDETGESPKALRCWMKGL
jgi:GNAT superfamily N-acetyltransferase